MSDTQKHTKSNVPNLRFPGFEGEWENVTIGQICSIVGGGTPDTNTKEYWNGDIQWFTPSEVGKEKYISDSNRTISIDGLKNSSAKLLPPYSILLSSRATVGECSINLKKCCTNQGFQSAVPNKDITSTEFLYYRLLSHKRELIKKACGSTFLEISAKQIAKLNTYLPTKSEQDKIASLLSLIDERISIQNKVIEKLKSLIRELNNKLMDNPLWNKVYLGDFMQFYSTNSLSWEQLSYESGRMKNLHYGLIHIGLPTMTDCKDNTLPYIQAPFIPKQFTICKDGDIAFADASEDTEEVGKAIELYNTGSMDVVCGLHTIHSRDIMGLTVVGFKGFAFNSKYFHDQLRRLAQGSKVYSITAENIKNCYIYVPEVTEQRRIVGLLLCLQDNIKCAERELNYYEMQKQFMLREMLV